mmetsp:Transcript_49974/g.108657  ORF Transcript_49974/g.108657 Transcript_49974/m.108657 type:complete len:504 (-) Transcript_49974:23-1534(-)
MASIVKPSPAGLHFLSNFFRKEVQKQIGIISIGITVIVLLCACFPSQEPEIFLALVTATIYYLHYGGWDRNSARSTDGPDCPVKKVRAKFAPQAPPRDCCHDTAHVPLPKASPKAGKKKAGKEKERKSNVMPIVPMELQAQGWEAEVVELLGKIARTPEVYKLVNDVVSTVKKGVQELIPEAEVMGFASGNPMQNKAFAMAVPEIHIVLKADSSVLLKRLESRYSQNGKVPSYFDDKKLQKCAVRACTEQLTSANVGLKFRRSAFTGDDPKVCLLVPSSLGLCTDSIAFDFSVNATTPLRAETVMSICQGLDSRTEGLILLVRRWARDRGIAHAARGHLTTYAWNLLVVFFLQAGQDGGRSLPPIRVGADEVAEQPIDQSGQKSVAVLFQEFFAFYARHFDLQQEAVSVRLGCRGPPLAEQILDSSEQGEGRVPVIEDPFEITRNLGNRVTSPALSRLREELARADELCSRGASLKELFELWEPVFKETAPEEPAAEEHDDCK